MKSDSFLASTGLVLERLVEVHGIDPQQFMRQVGINPATVRDAKARISSRLADAAFEKAAALIPDPAFALRAAQCWHPSNLGTLGYAWLSSGTLRNGLKRVERFSRIVGSLATFRCVDDANGLRFIYDHGRGDAPIGPVMADFILSIILDMCRTNFGDSLNPATVNLRRPEPEDQTPYCDFYACSVRFGASEDSFTLARHQTDRPLSTANHELATTFDAILTEQLAALSETNIPARCKAYLLRQLTSGEPSEEELATAMGMSRRTLQRRLGDLGLTYKSVLDGTRYDLALRYLGDPQRTVTEITFLLGFSEQSAFTRAFKRWSGKAPTSHRAQQPAFG